MKRTLKLETSSFFLHLLAMALMLCDHLWATVVPGNDWMNCLGRIAFPIFAFMVAEGAYYTRSMKKYVLRLLIFAVVSEIPFNLVAGGSWFYPLHQNVLWTFLLALLLIWWNERAKASGKWWKRGLIGALSIIIGYLAGMVSFCDYGYAGVLTVLVFYFFRGEKWLFRLAQLVCLWYINLEMLGGIGQEFTVFGQTVFFARQGFAVLALIPIWLYRGKQGLRSKALQYLYYGFYPAHLLVLGLWRILA